MNDPIISKHIGQYRYEVFPDLDYSIQHETDKACRKHIETLIESGDLTAYGVVKYKLCECCCMWSEIHSASLWGILCPNAEQALDEYIADHGGE